MDGADAVDHGVVEAEAKDEIAALETGHLSFTMHSHFLGIGLALIL